MRRTVLWICGLAAIATGCETLSVDPIKGNATTLYSRLELNHNNIILSVHAPYDTVLLRAVPKSLAGDIIQHAGDVEFLLLNPSDTSVRLDPSGLVTARASTNATRIVVQLTIDGLTWADTAVIMVRSELPVRKIARFEYFPAPPDSGTFWAGVGPLPSLTRFIRLFDSSDRSIPISQAVVGYTVDDDQVYGRTPAGGTLANGFVAGETYLKARTYAYGSELADSFLFRRIDPPVRFVFVHSVYPMNAPATISFAPGELKIRRGTTVIFINRFGGYLTQTACPDSFCKDRIAIISETDSTTLTMVDSVDVQFDVPEAVSAGDSYGTMSIRNMENNTSFPTDGGSGNIGPFAMLTCLNKNTVSFPRACGALSVSVIAIDAGYRSRKFDIPGTFHLTSSRFPGAKGTIIVEE